MKKKIIQIIMAIELVLLGLTIIGVVWIFISFRGTKGPESGIIEEKPIEQKMETETEEGISIPKGAEKGAEIFEPEERIVIRKKISPPAGLPQTPEEEKKFMESFETPPEPEEKEKKEPEEELPVPF